MNYKCEFERLLEMAKQVVPAIDFKNRTVKSFTELQGLKNAVDFYSKPPNNTVEDRQAKCICTPNGKHVKCPVHGFTGGFVSPPAT